MVVRLCLIRPLPVRANRVLQRETGRKDEGDTLATDLGFDTGDVEMLYYNSEPANASAVVSDGQGAPTASRFKSKLTSFLSSAEAGDVRFLYLDTLGAALPDGGSTGSADEERGLVLAENEQGTGNEIIYNDWLATTIREVSRQPFVLLCGYLIQMSEPRGRRQSDYPHLGLFGPRDDEHDRRDRWNTAVGVSRDAVQRQSLAGGQQQSRSVDVRHRRCH